MDPRDFEPAPAALANLEAEQGLIGALMFDGTVFERITDRLRGAHFFEPYHQRLFDGIADLIKHGRMPDPTILGERLKSDPAFGEFGGVRYLADLLDNAPSGYSAPDYARVIHDLAVRRDLIRVADGIKANVADRDLSAIQHVEKAEADLFALAETGEKVGAIVTFRTALDGAMELAEAAYKRDGQLTGLATQLHDLDQKLGGLHPSDLLILAGRPSMGKTALATNIAFNVAKNYQWAPDPEAPNGRKTIAGGVVGFWSLEMSAEQLGLRVLADASGVSSDKIRKGEIDAADFAKLRDAQELIADSPLYIDATGGISISKLAAKARRLKRSAEGLDLIIVDYLQLLTVEAQRGNNSANRVQEVTAITGGLKALAKELNVPIIALSQLSRQVENREDKRPMLADLRESGSIEQDADAVMFVYREDYYLGRAEPKEGTAAHLEWRDAISKVMGQAEVIIGKQRHGPIGTVRLAFNSRVTRFGNLARPADFGASSFGFEGDA